MDSLRKVQHFTPSSLKSIAAGLLITISVAVHPVRSHAQNMVSNPSFELFESCPTQVGFLGTSKPANWDAWQSSPEYFNACAGTGVESDTLIDVPLNGMGFQYALDGEAYVGVVTYPDDSYREYVGAELTEPMISGQEYDISFYANAAMGGMYWNPTAVSNNLGLLFTVNPNIWNDGWGQPFGIRNYAHLYASEIISDTASWTYIQGNFVADSAYRYVVLGNFFSDSFTDTLNFTSTLSPVYYFIDGVCVKPMGGTCSFNNSIDKPEGQYEELQLWPNPATTQVSFRGCKGILKIIDGLGREIKTIDCRQQRDTIDLSLLPPGVYTVVDSFSNRLRKLVITKP